MLPFVQVGDVVFYYSYGTPNGEYKSEKRAAVVTAVKDQETVSLCVLNPEGMFFNKDVKISFEEEPGHWGHKY